MPGKNLGKTVDSVSPSVWILDGDPAARCLTQRALERHGHQVVLIPDCKTFLSTYSQGDAHCLVLETRLPDGDGLAVQRELNALGDLLPLVYLASAADVPTAVAAMKGGASDFLLKPFDAAALIAAVKGAVGRSTRFRILQDTAIAARRLQNLTAREREVLNLVVLGLSTKQISIKLHRVEKTVEFHRQNIMRKVGASNVAHLVRLVTSADHISAQRHGNGHTPRSS